jgi:hypothetical protein
MRYDPDGTGPSASVKFGRLLNTPTVTNADFVVVNPWPPSRWITPRKSSRSSTADASDATAVLPAARPEARLSQQLLESRECGEHEVPSLKRVSLAIRQQLSGKEDRGTASVGSRMPLGGNPLSAGPDRPDPALDQRRR